MSFGKGLEKRKWENVMKRVERMDGMNVMIFWNLMESLVECKKVVVREMF